MHGDHCAALCLSAGGPGAASVQCRATNLGRRNRQARQLRAAFSLVPSDMRGGGGAVFLDTLRWPRLSRTFIRLRHTASKSQPGPVHAAQLDDPVAPAPSHAPPMLEPQKTIPGDRRTRAELHPSSGWHGAHASPRNNAPGPERDEAREDHWGSKRSLELPTYHTIPYRTCSSLAVW
jgi:hypothetical protein